MNGIEYAVFGGKVCCGFVLVLIALVAFFRLGVAHDTTKLMREFAEQFPHRCFLCSYHMHVTMCKPPEHDCKDWIAKP